MRARHNQDIPPTLNMDQDPTLDIAEQVFHRTLTEKEAAAVWAALTTVPLPHDGQELKITLKPISGSQVKGWYLYSADPCPQPLAD